VLIFICVIQTYFRVKTELKVIGHMSDPNSTSSDILSDVPVKDILRPAEREIVSWSKRRYCQHARLILAAFCIIALVYKEEKNFKNLKFCHITHIYVLKFTINWLNILTQSPSAIWRPCCQKRRLLKLVNNMSGKFSHVISSIETRKVILYFLNVYFLNM
jgi:hypothetical protein